MKKRSDLEEENVVIDYTDLELVGMNGSLIGCCGMVLAIAHRKSDDCYAFLNDYSRPDIPKYGKGEIDAFAREDRLQLFTEAVPAFPNAYALYVERSLLNAVGQRVEANWQAFGNDVLVMFVTLSQGNEMMDDWTTLLLEQIEPLLEKKEIEKADGLLKMAQFSSIGDPNLRAKVLRRWGQCLLLQGNRQGLINLNEFLKCEFPEWEGFIQEREVLAKDGTADPN